MKRLIETSVKNVEEVLEIYGGYTCIDDKLYVVTDRVMPSTARYLKSSLIVGIEYGFDGVELGHSYPIAQSIVKGFTGNEVRFLPGYGVYNKEIPSVEEKILLVSLIFTNDVQLIVYAERIRQAFRQEAVLVSLSSGETLYID